MQYKDMSEIDLKLALLSGGEISLDSLKIKPYTLKEIENYGYTKYTENLYWISLSVDDFIDSTNDEGKKNFLSEQSNILKAFDFYIKLGGKEIYDILLDTISMLFRTDDVEVLNDEAIVLDFVKLGIMSKDEDGNAIFNDDRLKELSSDDIKIINRDNFDDIVHIVKLQNYVEKPIKEDDNDDSNPADEETRKLMEHMKKMNKKVEEVKRQQMQDGEKEIDISDIISAVSSKSNSINKLNVWDFTLYQIYDEYARLELIDNYDFSIRAIIAHGAKIKLNHWSSKL